MSDDFTLKYSNGYANRSGKIDEDKLKINGDCEITNYDPRIQDGDKKGLITIKFTEYSQTIVEGTGEGLKSCETARFSNKKYSIFKELASLDENKDTLSMDDIKMLDKSYIEKWGLKDLKLDFRNGVATLIWGENDILRIDFQTWQENWFGKAKESFVLPEEVFTNNESMLKDNLEVAKIISTFEGGRIDIKDVKDLESVAKYTGMSESYIRDVLIGLEGKKSWPLCEAEYDGVKSGKFPKGCLTIAFGHTSLIGPPEVTEGMEISERQAFQILANDIIESEKIAKNKLKSLYDKAPKSIQDSIVDMVFNKGPKSINKNLIANLKEGFYASTALRTWYETPVVGLQKRNMYRFMAALEDLDQMQKQDAIKRFQSERINQLKRVFKKDIEAKKAWNEMCSKYKCNEYKF